jgi:hypothetical protein
LSLDPTRLFSVPLSALWHEAMPILICLFLPPVPWPTHPFPFHPICRARVGHGCTPRVRCRCISISVLGRIVVDSESIPAPSLPCGAVSLSDLPTLYFPSSRVSILRVPSLSLPTTIFHRPFRSTPPESACALVRWCASSTTIAHSALQARPSILFPLPAFFFFFRYFLMYVVSGCHWQLSAE